MLIAIYIIDMHIVVAFGSKKSYFQTGSIFDMFLLQLESALAKTTTLVWDYMYELLISAKFNQNSSSG